MVDDSIRRQIADRLDRIERENTIRVLYACESGSRAWGFPSADSDYDVRFIYVHPRDWYLSIDLERRDDTIDRTEQNALDLHGWDLRKALGLFRKSNPTLLEWMQSPIVYREVEAVIDRWRDLLPAYYRPRAAGHAYRSMAQSIAQQNLTGETISRKAYLYVLRALLAVRWVEQNRGPVPMEFVRLVDATVRDTALRTAIDTLIAEKRAGTELEEPPRLPTLHDFIEAEIDRQKDVQFRETGERPDLAPLNTLFRTVLEGQVP